MYCPQCGTSNSADALFCTRCNAPLTTASSSDDSLPPWLRQFDQDAPAAPPAPAPTGLPDWLQAPTAPPERTVAAPSNDLPPWLRDLEAAPVAETASPPPAAQSDDLPPWLRELQETTPAPAPLPAPSPPAFAADNEPLPAWLADLQAAPEQSRQSTSAPADDIPDWLRDVALPTAPTEQPAQSAPSSDLPSWLNADQPAAPPPSRHAPEPEPAALADDVPDWLRDVAPFSVAESTPQQPAASAPSGDLPSWLNADQPSAPPPSRHAPAPEPAALADDVPDWLRDVALPTAPTEQPAQSTSNSDLPSWLNADQPSAPPPFVPEDDAEPMPDWLHKMQPSTSSVAAQTPTFESQDQTIGTRQSGMGDLPTWLRDFDTEPPIIDISDEDLAATDTTNDVPAWLREASTSAAVPPPSSAHTQLDSNDDDAVPAWLQPQATASAPAPAPTPAADDIPEWLRIADEQAIVAPTPTAPPADNPPTWLTQSDSPAQPFALEDLAIEATAGNSDVPDWLRDIDQEAQATVQATTGTPSAPTDDLPAWLKADAPSQQPSQPSSAEPSANDKGLPAWLREDSPVAPQATVRLDAVPPALDADIPAWLREDAPVAPQATVRLEDVPPAPDADIPAWLREDSPATPQATVRLEDGSPTVDADIPAWLREDSPVAPQATVRLDQATSRSGGDTVTPSWLLDDAPTAPSTTETADDSMFGSVDLPAWLRQSVGNEPAVPEPTILPESPDWLRTLGGTQPTPVTDDQPQTIRRSDIALPPTIARSPERIAAVEMLRELVMQPTPLAAPVPEAATATWWQKIGVERIVALLLLSAILLGLLVPNLPFNTAPNALNTKAVDLHTYIESLSPDSRVMIAYEADLQRSAELAPLEEAVVDHIVAKGVPTVLLTTDVQGALVKNQRVARIEANNPDYNIGTHYLDLRYQAGGTAVLRSFAQNARAAISNELIAQDLNNNVDLIGIMSKVSSANQFDSAIINTMDDFDLLVLVADEQTDVQDWVEQVWSQYPALPVAIITTNETAPLIQPFIQVRGDFYPLVGLAGAQAYNVLQNTTTSGSVAPINALSMSGIVLTALIVGGGLIGIGQRMRRRRNS